MKKNAYVTFIIRNDSYLPGALVFAYALRRQKTSADLVCIVSDNLSDSAIGSLKEIYDHVLILEEIYVPHERRHERQDRPFLFTRFHAFRLGKDGDLGFQYDKIIIADCDVLPLHNYDSIFELKAPAGIINEFKKYCMNYTDDGKYIIPDSVYESGTWNWHEIYKDYPHGSLLPKEITDRCLTDKLNMGINASLMLFHPSMELFTSILDDVKTEETQELISTFDWPEMQYITQKLSGQWSNVDLRYSSFNGYPSFEYLNGIHFTGLKPWNIKNKSVKNFAKFSDYQLWFYTYNNMMNDHPKLMVNKKLRLLYDYVTNLYKDDKYRFNQTNIKHLKHLFQ